MTKKKIRKVTEAAPESPLMINLRITVPRRAVWMTSGFLTGGITTEAIIRLLNSLHGG